MQAGTDCIDRARLLVVGSLLSSNRPDAFQPRSFSPARSPTLAPRRAHSVVH